METRRKVVFASFWRRLAAFVIDSCVVAIPTMITVGITIRPILGLDWGERPEYGFGMIYLRLMTVGLLANLVWYGYFALSDYLSGQTFGKYFLGIKVVPLVVSMSRLRFGVMRELVGRGLLSYVPFYNFLDYLWFFIDKDKQTIHDKLGGTIVVRV